MPQQDMTAHLNQAFSNVNDVLKNAGSKGWDDVFLIRAYFSRLHEDGLSEAWPEVAKQWLPNHRPVLTAYQVGALWVSEMRVEIEVEALVDSK